MSALSKRVFYAIEAVLYIAYNGVSERVSSKEISGKQGMPPRYLEQMMQKLVHAGVLRGIRGPNGGYLLAREKRRITLADIAKAIGEDEEIPSSTTLGNHIIVPVINKFHEALKQQLSETTIADLCEQANRKNIRKTSEEHTNFNI